MRKFFVALVAIVSLGCTVSQEDADRVLGDEGLHNVTLTGHDYFACSEDDSFNSGFVAYRTVLSPDGTPSEVRVEGVICCGWFKACTVRH